MNNRYVIFSLAAALLSMTSFHFPQSQESTHASTEAVVEAPAAKGKAKADTAKNPVQETEIKATR